MKILVMALFAVFAFVPVAIAGDSFTCKSKIPAGDFQDIIENVEDEFNDTDDFAAQFIQKSYFVGLDRSDYSRGEIFFKRPAKMKWNYQAPEEQQFVVDGQNVWFYQPVLKQVTVGDFESSFRSDMPVSFLLGLNSIRDRFFIENMCRTENGIKISLKPKQDDGNLKTFELLVKADNYVILGAQIDDFGGNETTIGFSAIQLNRKLAENMFVFNVPKGADIIDHRGPKKNGVSNKVNVKEENIFEPLTREQVKSESKQKASPVTSPNNVEPTKTK